MNAKVSNPAVCNSAETVLIHQGAVKNILPDLIDRLIKEGVEVRGSEEVCALDSRCQKAGDADWGYRVFGFDYFHQDRNFFG